jgi:hypothetical protein
MFEFPIIYFENNIIVNNRYEYWAIYKLKCFDYDFKNTEKKFEIRDNLMRFIANIGERAKVLIVPIVADYDNYFDFLKKRVNPKSRLYKNAIRHLEKTREHVKDNFHNDVNDYEVYILTKLNPDANIESFREMIGKIVTDPVVSINSYFRLANKITKAKLKKYKSVAIEYQKDQNRRISIEEATEEDIQWLIKRTFFRGCKEDIKLFENWKPSFDTFLEKTERFIETDKEDMVMTLTSGEIDLSESRMVKINHDSSETSYQSFLCLTKVIDVSFPGEEFLLYPQMFGFPIEICINLNNIKSRDAIKKLEGKKRAIKSQGLHEESAGDLSDEVLDARRDIEGLESELKSEDAPLVKCSISMCIYSNDKKVLENRVSEVLHYYRDNKFGIERPKADQYKLFFEFLPGTYRYNKNFTHHMTPKFLASGIFGVTSEIGDNLGVYIGKAGGLGKPVFLDLNYACRINKPSAGLIIGSQGFGKSFNTNLLVYLHVLCLHAKAFIVDPKGDRKNWDINIQELQEHINIIELRAGQDKGRLDPFIIYRDSLGEAKDLAINLITERFNIKEDGTQHLALEDAIDRVIESGNPSMKKLVEELFNCPKNDKCFDSAELLARKISKWDCDGLSGLLFSDGNVDALGFNKKINVVMIQDLKIPASSRTRKEDYNADEKLGTVLMLAVSNFARRFATHNNRIRKLIVLDEAWALARTKQGEELFERLARTGRSLNLSTLFIAHSVEDIKSEGIREAIRYKFIFHNTDRAEAIRTLKFLNMDTTEENVSLLSSDEKGLGNGECLFSDVEGRISVLKFDAVSNHLIEAFQTTPTDDNYGFGEVTLYS